ncbi:hypothetical protein FIM1_1023 [Kluyveromyces marxianus]|uniref:Uncharacterized protein n=1 Tax=Kluyveromyces marxianus TaxID=4911 RepID=A0ABX6EVU6_KLUMA|nr:hypothetical protein FIM1_1023 [Kluyveromyces marxianus]
MYQVGTNQVRDQLRDQLLPRHLKVVTWVRLYRYFRYPASVDCVRATLTIPHHVCKSFIVMYVNHFGAFVFGSRDFVPRYLPLPHYLHHLYIYIYSNTHTHIDMDIYIYTYIYIHTHTYQGLIPLRWASTLETGSHSPALFLRVFSLETQKIDLAILKDI